MKCFSKSLAIFEILSGNQTHRDFGRSLRRDHRLGPLLDIAAPNAVHVERGANTRAFDGRKARFALDIADFERFLVFCKVERSLVEGFALGGRQLAHVVVEARNRHVSVFIDERSHHAGQDIGRIGHRTSEQAGVQVLVGACHFDLHIESRPRRPQVIEGICIEIIDVSETRMMSALSIFLLSAQNL